ncbi:MAG: carbon-nitrogen hydrolase family protein [Phycisphaerae bacterium]
MKKRFHLAVAAIGTKGIVQNILDAITEAGDRKVDLLVLPEEPDIMTQVPPGKYPLEKHPIYQKVRKAAIKAKVPVVMTLSVKIEDRYANLGFLMDAMGRIVGMYNKKHPAPSEETIITKPLFTEDPFPVFDLNGVKIALAICMDIHFPEMFRIYGLKGADIVCVSTMYMDYTGDMLESLEKARAIDSQMYFALSRYIQLPYLAGKSMGYAKVIAPDGRVIASTGHQPGIVVTEIDPKWRFPSWYEGDLLKAYPDFRVMFDKIRRPDIYGDLVSVTEKP